MTMAANARRPPRCGQDARAPVGGRGLSVGCVIGRSIVAELKGLHVVSWVPPVTSVYGESKGRGLRAYCRIVCSHVTQQI